jgi:hypothetical protein
MRPVHTLHLYQPDDRFAIVATSGNPPQTNPRPRHRRSLQRISHSAIMRGLL